MGLLRFWNDKIPKRVNLPPLGFSFESKISFEALESIVKALESIFEVEFAFFGVF